MQKIVQKTNINFLLQSDQIFTLSSNLSEADNTIIDDTHSPIKKGENSPQHQIAQNTDGILPNPFGAVGLIGEFVTVVIGGITYLLRSTLEQQHQIRPFVRPTGSQGDPEQSPRVIIIGEDSDPKDGRTCTQAQSMMEIRYIDALNGQTILYGVNAQNTVTATPPPSGIAGVHGTISVVTIGLPEDKTGLLSENSKEERSDTNTVTAVVDVSISEEELKEMGMPSSYNTETMRFGLYSGGLCIFKDGVVMPATDSGDDKFEIIRRKIGK
jgi:hypothetical protein